jgi:hypothetical protein
MSLVGSGSSSQAGARSPGMLGTAGAGKQAPQDALTARSQTSLAGAVAIDNPGHLSIDLCDR